MRTHLWLIHLLGVIVPRRLRADWRQEWEAELSSREELLAEWDRLDWRGKLDLLRRSTSAFWDALLLQPRRLEDEMFQDLRFGARMLRKTPGVSAIAVLTLALGIGANAAIFCLYDALMLRTLPVQKPEQLVMFKRVEASNREIYDLSYPQYERLRDESQAFSEVAANWLIERSEAAESLDADPGQIRVGMASGNYFSTLGVGAIRGRTFNVEDNRTPGGHPIAVISYAYWERRFATAPDIIGRRLTVAGTTFMIIGVTPRDFTGEWLGRPADLWVPFMMASQVMPEVPGGPSKFPALVIGRLKPGVTREQAQAASQMIYQQQLRDDAGSNLTAQQSQIIAQRRLEIEAAAGGYSAQRRPLAQPLAILAWMVGLILLAVCANVANLLLARGEAREREMAVRQALGAPRCRLMKQLLTEAMLLASIGGALGLLFAVWGTRLLTMMLSASPLGGGVQDQSILLDLRLDGRVLLYTAALCLLTCLIFGLVPAWRSSKMSLSSALTVRSASSSRFSFGKMLVVAQVALALVLLLGAGLLLRTLRNLQTQDLGFNRNNLLLVWVAPVRTGRTVPDLANFAATVRERLSSLPGVASTSISTGGVLDGSVTGGPSENLKMQGQGPKPGLALSSVSVTPGFFETVGTPLIAGRDFSEQDSDAAPQVAIVNETMARFFFGNENPVGKRCAARGETDYPIEIIGVVKDAKLGTPRDQRGAWFFPYRQNARFLRLHWCIAVRTTQTMTSQIANIRQSLRELDPNLPLLKINTLDGQLKHVLIQERIIGALSGFFGALAALLSCLGLYGVISYTIARRTHEIGVRLALGATPPNVLRMLFKQSFWPALGGVAIGLPLALAAARLISSRLYGVSPTDLFTISTAVALLLTVAALAAFLPLRSAVTVDPMTALRRE